MFLEDTMKTVDGYTLVPLTEELRIDHLVTVHYFEYSKNYIFEGEKHDFWEFLYVDKGEISVKADDRNYILKQGEMIFHKPNEWHNVIANGKVAPNLVVISFDTKSSSMKYFHNKVISIDNDIKTYLGHIIEEAKNTFTCDISAPKVKDYIKREQIKFGSEQLIKLYLELTLLELIRNEYHSQPVTRTSPYIKEYAGEDKVNIIIDLLKENLHRPMNMDDISRETLLSKSSLQRLFRDHMKASVMDYYKQLKIKEAKKLIREDNHNFTEIAELLGYNSIHYFSRLFKTETGMTLSEYANSVKILID